MMRRRPSGARSNEAAKVASNLWRNENVLARTLRGFVAVGCLALAAGCTAAAGGDASETATGAPEPDDGTDVRATESLLGTVPVGSSLKTNAAVNFRASPSTSATIYRVLPLGTVVTVASSTPNNGWYNISYGGRTGWTYGVYLDKVASSGGGGSGGGTVTDSCNPARAIGIVSAPRKALLDTIAYCEGTLGRSQDGYNVLFTGKTVSECNVHPNQTICSGGLCSTAAGRYQFLTTTWNGLKLPNFRPENQTTGAMTLITWRKATIPSDRPMTATELANVMDKISYEWASLPPGRYGQPSKTEAQVRAEYCKLAGC